MSTVKVSSVSRIIVGDFCTHDNSAMGKRGRMVGAGSYLCNPFSFGCVTKNSSSQPYGICAPVNIEGRAFGRRKKSPQQEVYNNSSTDEIQKILELSIGSDNSLEGSQQCRVQ